MMNVLALSLVLTSLAAAGVWSPTPPQREEDVIVKQGHRVVVVDEYDDDGKHNTKVSNSSPPPQHQTKLGKYFGRETVKEAPSALPNLGQGISPLGELTCGAFGECTHTISTVSGKAKDKASETAHDAKEKVKDKVAETAQEAKEKVSETVHSVKDKASDSANEAKEKLASSKKWVLDGTKDKVSETAQQTKGAVGEALGKAKEAVTEKGQDVKESAKESIDKAKNVVKDTSKAIWDHIMETVTKQVDYTREKAMEEGKEAKENIEQAATKAKTSANKFFDGIKYMTSMESLKSLMGMANLLGLATAYGMSVWVTFISSYVLAEVLPRQQFGVVQSKIYPVYFRAMAYSIGLALSGHLLGHGRALFSSKPEMFQAFNLLSSLFVVLVNALYLVPKATKDENGEGRRQRRDDFASGGRRATEAPSVANPAAIRTGEGPSSAATTSEEEVVKLKMARLNERLKKLNTNSSLVNVLTLMALTWHLVYLGQRLSFTC